MIKTAYSDALPYTTKDGSTIRELMHPDVHGNVRQSPAEAALSAGSRSVLHLHGVSEEIYHIIEGDGLLTVGSEMVAVGPGDTVCIPPGTAHRIENTGSLPLRFLCCSAPPYSDEDTRLMKTRKSVGNGARGGPS